MIVGSGLIAHADTASDAQQYIATTISDELAKLKVASLQTESGDDWTFKHLFIKLQALAGIGVKGLANLYVVPEVEFVLEMEPQSPSVN